MSVKDYNVEPELNVSISGINSAGGCAPSGINDAIRQLMADVKEEQNARAARDSGQDAATAAAQKSADDAQTAADAAQSTADGKAPKAHASTATTYGIGTSSNYGHVKLSDSTSSTSAASKGIAASPKAVKAAYDKAAAAYLPVGSVIAFAGNPSSAPSGYLLCNGAAVSRTTYAALFEAIGTAYGAG
ncbi:MAG: tail fiber protein, partial [Mailhella sp.]|nr:tail fiber protein [Mailhella sp.]